MKHRFQLGIAKECFMNEEFNLSLRVIRILIGYKNVIERPSLLTKTLDEVG